MIDGGNLRNFPYQLDYLNLYNYVTKTLGASASEVFYFGAMPTSYYFKMYDWLSNEHINLESFESWLDGHKNDCKSPLQFRKFLNTPGATIRLPDSRNDLESAREKALTEAMSIDKQLQFILYLKENGYQVELTPLKHHISHNNQIKRKGDSDIRIAVKIFELLPKIDKLIFVSGDGDFLSLLKMVKKNGKDVVVMGYKSSDKTTNRTAKEISSFAGGKFLNLASSDMKTKFEYHKKK